MVNSNNGSTPASGNGGTTGGGSSAAGGGSQSGSATSGAISATTLPQSGFRDEVTNLATGLKGLFPDGTSVVVNGQSMTKDDVINALEAVVTQFAGVDAAVQSLREERLGLKAALPGAHQFVASLKGVLIGLFGKGSPALQTLGIARKHAPKLTSEQKSARAAKALATRELRGTRGKRQKAGVKFTGQVEVQTVMKPSGAPIAGLTALAPGGDTGASSSTPSAK